MVGEAVLAAATTSTHLGAASSCIAPKRARSVIRGDGPHFQAIGRQLKFLGLIDGVIPTRFSLGVLVDPSETGRRPESSHSEG